MKQQHTTDKVYKNLEEQGAQGGSAEEMSLGRKACGTISSLVTMGGGAGLLYLAALRGDHFDATLPGFLGVLAGVAGITGLVYTHSSSCRKMGIFNEGRQPSTSTNDPNPTTLLLGAGPGSSGQ